jgi:hypothetical protein
VPFFKPFLKETKVFSCLSYLGLALASGALALGEAFLPLTGEGLLAFALALGFALLKLQGE